MQRTTYRALSFVALLLTACTTTPSSSGDPIASDAAVAVARASEDASPLSPLEDAATSPTPRATTAPPIGPSLLVLQSGDAVVADPDRDRLYVVSLAESRVARVVDLPRGVEPGRLVEDGRGRVHVVLRRGGGIATLEPGAVSVTRRDVCAAPRGLAWRAADESLVVACAEGVVAVLPASEGPPSRIFHLDDDLRDVVILGDHVLVSRFRSAEVLVLDEDGAEVARYRPATADRVDVLAPLLDPTSPGMATFEPEVAWRLIPAGAGAWLLHQRARTTAIPVATHGISYGAPSPDPAHDCGFGLVESSVSVIADGQPSGALAPSLPLTAVLATDITFVPPARTVAPVEPIAAPRLADDGKCARLPSSTIGLSGGAVAYSARYGVIRASGHPLALGWTADGVWSHVDLAGELEWTDAEIGRSIFQSMPPSRIACMSCHPEGGEDGHVWAQGSGGALRTQSVQGRILGTAPFHWEGDMPDFDSLVAEVWVGRMRGTPMHPARTAAFASWIDALDPPPRPLADGAAVARGQRLFESVEHECSSCHAGPRYSSGDTVDVGTGGAFQVPVLVGVAYRAPYMHSGCAATLTERFTGSATCTGGDLHGHTSDLSPGEIDDLVAYLRSL